MFLTLAACCRHVEFGDPVEFCYGEPFRAECPSGSVLHKLSFVVLGTWDADACGGVGIATEAPVQAKQYLLTTPGGRALTMPEDVIAARKLDIDPAVATQVKWTFACLAAQ
jgi:hypothetical protein